MSFHKLTPIAAAMLFVGTSFVTASAADRETDAASKNAAEKEQTPAETEPNSREFVFEVLTTEGEPVPGATVTPWGVMANFGSFPLDKKRFPSLKTDENGIVRVLFAKDPEGFEVKAGDNTGRLLRDLEQGILSHVTLVIDHPDHPVWSQSIPVRAGKITLENSVTLQIRAHTSDNARFVRENLFPVLPESFSQDINWTQENGLLTIRRVDVTSKKAARSLRVVHAPENGPVHFSSLVDLKDQGENPILLRLPLKPGVRVDGRLSENVPRPVKNGRIVALIAAGLQNPVWRWSVTADISEGGTFVLESLPTDEHLQIIALCDGWVSTSPTQDEVADYVAEHSFTDPKYQGPSLTHVNPQLYHLSGQTIEPVLPMEPTSTCEVTVVDPEGKPISDASVSFAPNQFWFNWGAQIVGTGFDCLSKVRATLASGDHRVNMADFVRNQSYSVKTDARGIATIRNLPPGGHDQPALVRNHTFHVWHDNYLAPGNPKDQNRMCKVEILPGESKGTTITMTPK